MSVALGNWKPLSGCRVLLAEDQEDARHLYTLSLTRGGADVVAADDGSSALEAWAAGRRSRKPFDVAVLDLTMPGMRGTEAAAALRAGGFSGAVVGLTATASPEEVEYWLAAGCDAVLRKGISWRDLVAATVEVCLRRWMSVVEA